ncbi:MAG: hypothetical protein F4027_01310 [Rhodospirillaceae bacterium]|nr:hypothetical protein [Rhodospirillaceae bacterium]MYK57297.1 hypothetical protein [Rhodospirillaceae bacterium]
MTDAEQDRLLAELVRERRDLRLTISCLEERLRKSRNALNTAARLAENAYLGQQISHEPLSPYLSHSELAETLKALEEAKARRSQIEGILDE